MLQLGIILDKKGARKIDEENPAFFKLTKYIEEKINTNGLEVLKELEVATQTKTIMPNKKFKIYDIERANKRNQELGKKGEELINKHLIEQVNSGKIINFTWYNEKQESGLPYDFSIQDKHNNIFFLDVKTTGYDFKQKMIFSSQEIKFIANSNNNYGIYRVYMNNDDSYYLRICNDCKDLSARILDEIDLCSTALDKIQVDLQSSKLAIPPDIISLKFSPEISISAC